MASDSQQHIVPTSSTNQSRRNSIGTQRVQREPNVYKCEVSFSTAVLLAQDTNHSSESQSVVVDHFGTEASFSEKSRSAPRRRRFSVYNVSISDCWGSNGTFDYKKKPLATAFHIDRFCAKAFPLTFLIFNVAYWTHLWGVYQMMIDTNAESV